MSRRLGIALVAVLGVLAVGPAPAGAQGTGPCTHQGRPVQCPAGLPPGSQSVSFVPGGTNWRNSATGAVVFVPSTTFPPFVASPTPTTPPGPTTQPGPGQPPGGPVPGSPLTADGLLTLTRPSNAPAGRTTEDATKDLLVGLAGLAFRNADDAYKEARRQTQAFYDGLREERNKGGLAFVIHPGVEVLRQTTPDGPADRVDQAATERMKQVEGAEAKARAEYEAALEAWRTVREDLTPTPDLEDSEPDVERADGEKAPTFEPFKDQGAVDEVM